MAGQQGVTPTTAATRPMLALTGRVVTMDSGDTVLAHATVYLRDGVIVDVRPATAAPPEGFEKVEPVDTGATIYPGLIELHNHLSYNALRLWQVPQRYGNRGQWAGTPQYRQLVTAPMKILGGSAHLVAAVVRWVEAKCLVAGTTTSQGIALFSNAGVRRYYRGVIRVVESTDDPTLPEAATRIPDVDARDLSSFRGVLEKHRCVLLHLAEGTDDAALSHFLALKQGDSWALRPSLAGIHCVPLRKEHFALLAEHGASMVWSPLSNLLLYGGTADVAAARSAGVRIAIGADWAPSGSKNLFGEMKAARVYVRHNRLPFDDRDILAMATRNAAAVLGWDGALGSVEKGKKADLVLVDGTGGDPYRTFFTAAEAGIKLVVCDGWPRFGDSALMRRLRVRGEKVRIGGASRTVSFDVAAEDPAVAAITLGEARRTLTTALRELPRSAGGAAHGAELAPPPPWSLALDELGGTGMAVRPLLGGSGAEMAPAAADVAPLPLVSLRLDPLTVADDGDWLERLGNEPNLPAYMVRGLRAI
jgi:cytosine/adenosine deaminase-related metal-dependent hydrolase